MTGKRNAARGDKFVAEQQVLADLPPSRFDHVHRVTGIKVRSNSTIQVKRNMFPTSHFRIAYDWLCQQHGSRVAVREYLKILQLAARDSQDAVFREHFQKTAERALSESLSHTEYLSELTWNVSIVLRQLPVEFSVALVE